MGDEHKHVWSTRYITIDEVDCADGMQCECGLRLNEDAVEEIVNRAHSSMDLSDLRMMDKDGYFVTWQ